MSKALEYLLSRPLLCTPEAAEVMAAIVSRDPDAEPVEARSGNFSAPKDDSRIVMGKHAGVSVIPVRGGISRYTTMMQDLGCGGVSVDSLTKDIKTAAADPMTRSILLDIDSPGGEANGIGELAGLIKAIDANKPVYGYVGGMGGSAAYWIASACRQIACAEASELGSIGAVCGIRTTADRPGTKTYKFISSQSPLKQADPATKEGHEAWQQRCDALASVFVANVAKNRGTTPERVMSDFGKGAVMLGHAAVACGMADGVSDFDTVLGRLAKGETACEATRPEPEPEPEPEPTASATKGKTSMNFLALIGLAQKNKEVAAALGVAEADLAEVAAADLAAGKPAQIPADAVAKIKADAVAEFKAELAKGQEATFLANAESWFTSLVAKGKALPTQKAAVVAMHVDAAKADATAGPMAVVTAADGTKVTTSRLAVLTGLFGSAPAVDKTKDAVSESPEAVAKVSGFTALPADDAEAGAKAEAEAKAKALRGFGPVAAVKS